MPKRIRRSPRRLVRNLAIGLFVVVGGVVVAWLTGSSDRSYLWSMATAYVGLALLAATLVLGPWNVVRSRPNPVSTHLRRDLGIWGCGLALVHTWVGLGRHMGGRWLEYFFHEGRPALDAIRLDLFGGANWTGAAATVLVAGLAAVSNDVSLRRLGAGRWKALQRANYALFPLVVLHALAYQAASSRALPWIVVVTLAALFTAGVQAAGVARVLRGGGDVGDLRR